jgi:hypothetical protein
LKICCVMCLSYSLIPTFCVVYRELSEYNLLFLNKSRTFYWGMHLQNSDSLLDPVSHRQAYDADVLLLGINSRSRSEHHHTLSHFNREHTCK